MDSQFSNIMAASGYKVGMIITGGGMTAATESTRHGGASSWFLGAELPYAYSWSGKRMADPSARRVTQEAADDMAMDLWSDHKVQGAGNLTIAASCTAALVSEGEREGRQHRAFITICRNNDTYPRLFSYCLKLRPQSRNKQEHTVASIYCALIHHHTQSDEPLEHGWQLQMLNKAIDAASTDQDRP